VYFYKIIHGEQTSDYEDMLLAIAVLLTIFEGTGAGYTKLEGFPGVFQYITDKFLTKNILTRFE